MSDTGQTPGLPAGSRIYAIGDVHGRADCLKQLLQKIHVHMQEYPATHVTLVCLGDYIDRGPDSKGVIEQLLHLPFEAETVFLMGNHEYALLRFLEGDLPYEVWLRCGGGEMMKSYGVTPCAAEAKPEKIEEIRTQLAANLPDSHLDFFRNLRLSYAAGGYVFVHAGIRPGIAMEDQQMEDLLMIRADFLYEPVTIAQTIIHGHTPCNKPLIREKSIGIDTAAYATGVLTSIILEDTTHAFLHT